MKYVHIGWCQEDKHDKVWGVIELQPHKYVTFWGRRGPKLQTKIVEGGAWQMDEMFRKKRNKGYDRIEEWELDEVYPEFKSDLEKTAFWATFKV